MRRYAGSGIASLIALARMPNPLIGSRGRGDPGRSDRLPGHRHDGRSARRPARCANRRRSRGGDQTKARDSAPARSTLARNPHDRETNAFGIKPKPIGDRPMLSNLPVRSTRSSAKKNAFQRVFPLPGGASNNPLLNPSGAEYKSSSRAKGLCKNKHSFLRHFPLPSHA